MALSGSKPDNLELAASISPESIVNKKYAGDIEELNRRAK
jgi:hypothetical protein